MTQMLLIYTDKNQRPSVQSVSSEFKKKIRTQITQMLQIYTDKKISDYQFNQCHLY